MRFLSGVTDQYLYFVGVDATDLKTRETGLSSFTVYRSRNGGAAAAMTTPTINETDSVNMPGVYELLLDEDMTIDAGDDSQEMCFHITHAGMAPVTRTIELYRAKITAGNTLGVASDGDVSGNVDGSVASVGSTVSADVVSVSGDSAAANNLEADYDGTGYAKTNSTIGTCTTNTDMRGTDSAALASSLGTPSDLGGGATLSDNLSDMAGATFSSATDSQEAIRDRGDAAWTTGAGGSDRLLMVDTTIATLASQTSFTLTAGSADDDAYNNCTIVIEDASTATQKAVGVISDYTGSTKTVTLLYDPAVFTMATTDKVYILAENALKAALANRQLNVSATGEADADAVKISTSSDAADRLEASAETIVIGAAAAGTLSTTEMTTDLTEATDDHYNGRIIIWTSGVLKDQATDITDYTGSGGKLTFTAVTEAPSASDTFVIV